MILNFEKILRESDLNEYSGEFLFKYESFLSDFSYRSDFSSILEIELKKSIAEKNHNRFSFICDILISFGQNLREYQTIYCCMIDFVNEDFENRSSGENENLLTIVLDLIWHQDEGLKELSNNQQLSLNLLLKNAARHSYQIDENGDEIFFAIKKAIDLLKFQKGTGNTEDIIEHYINHFDKKIREEATEMKARYKTVFASVYNDRKPKQKLNVKMKLFKIIIKIVLLILILLSLFLWFIINASSHDIKTENRILPLFFALFLLILLYLTKFLKPKNEN